MEGFQKRPEWAKRFGYDHFSNPQSKHFSWAVFDKAVIRPQLNKAWNILKSDVPKGSKKHKDAKLIIDKYSYDSAPMCLGRTIQSICDARLLPEQELKHTYGSTDRIEIEKDQRSKMEKYTFDEYTPNDDEKAHACREVLDPTLDNAMRGLEHAFKALGLNTWEGETNIKMDLNGIEIPYFFKPDFNNLIELKIRSPRYMPKSKKGWATGSLPSKPYASWLGQVSAYYFKTGRQPIVVCANDRDYRLYHPDEGDYLMEKENLEFTFDQIVSDLKIQQYIMKNAEDLNELVQFVQPDWEHLSWSNKNPEVLQEAKDLWGYRSN